MLTNSRLVLQRIDPTSLKLNELLVLLRSSFAYMDSVIDPPSSVHLLTHETIQTKCAEEVGIVALQEGTLRGCVFLAEREDHFYLSKFAVAPNHQGRGIARLLLARAQEVARDAGKPSIELHTRIELTQNHAVFARFGFIEVTRTSHPGYECPTTIVMRKALT